MQQNDPREGEEMLEFQIVWDGNTTSKDPIEQVRKFLHFTISINTDTEEIRNSITLFTSDEITKASLEGIEWIANETPQGVSLEDILRWDAGESVDDEETARFWLLEFAEFIRDILRSKLKEMYADLFEEDEDMPPRKYPVLVSRPRKFFYPE